MRIYFLNPSIVGFLFAALFYMLVSSGKILFYTELESFFHWGMFFKGVFHDHNFDIWNNSLCVNHRVYPHGMAAWYSLFALGKSVYAERFLFQKDCHEKKKILHANICMLLLFYFCNLFLLWTYLTTMLEGEAVVIVCYGRYIGSCIIGWFDAGIMKRYY